MYKAIEYFEDLQDNRHPYKVGDVFPREGKEVDSTRILSLLSKNNKRGRAVIEEIAAPAEQVVEVKAEEVTEAPAEPVTEAEIPAEEIMNAPVEEAEPKKRSRKNK